MVSERINYLMSHFACFDNYAQSKYEIDSKREWELLGNFLNGKEPINPDEPQNTNSVSVNQLNDEERSYLSKIYNDLKAKYENNTLPEREDRIKKMYEKKEYKNKEYTKLINSLTPDDVADMELLVLADICRNQNRSESQLQQDMDHVIGALKQKAEELGIDVDELLVEGDNRKTVINLKQEIEQTEERKAKDKEIDKIVAKRNDPNDKRTDLEKAAEEKFVELNGHTEVFVEPPFKPSVSEFGNGFCQADGEVKQGSAIQQTGNCWLMGGANSLTAKDKNGNGSSKEFEKFNDNIYRDQLHGTTAVKIPEAEKANCGYDGKGIYAYSDYHTSKCDKSHGDNDFAAYNQAVEDYFKEKLSSRNPFCNEEDGSIVGNTNYRFYELHTGMKGKEFDGKNVPDGVGYTDTPDFDTMYNHIQNGGKAVLSVLFDPNREYSRHAISVVDAKDGKIIVQESNNSEDFAKQFEGSWQDENGIWNIPMDKDVFDSRIRSAGTLKA